MQLDILFVNPNTSKVYQNLSTNLAAREPPTWSMLLAESCRSKGFSAAILDCDVEQLTNAQAVQKIKEINPKLVAFIGYGANPNSGTVSMDGIVSLANDLREIYPQYKTISIGSHTSALPKEVLDLKGIDFVSINESVYTLHELLKTDLSLNNNFDNIPGLGYKFNGDYKLNPGKIVPQELMDYEMPGYAIDLLPYKNKPFDLYRCHNWHVNYDSVRSPFISIYGQLGCYAKCKFCMINLINRVDKSDGVYASQSNIMRFWSTDWIIKQIDKLMGSGVKIIRWADELLFANKKYYEPLMKKIVERGYGDDIISWAYARVNTVKSEYLDLFRKAGVRWLALGIEAASQKVRQEITKGQFKDIDIREITETIHKHDINVISNFMFGFENENYNELQQTLDLALELNTESVNMYCTTALPGSELYYEAKQKGWELPTKFSEYGFYSYDHLPLKTNYLSAADVLRFRDESWQKYFTNKNYLDLVERKFGLQQRLNVEEMSKIKLKRKILSD